jgi:hypothetical protein
MPNNAQRRSMLRQQKVLKIKNEMHTMSKLAVDFREAQRENGRKIHESNLDRAEKQHAEFVESKLIQVKEGWKSQGYNDQEIVMLEEAWKILTFKNKKTWQDDKKLARKLMSQAEESRNQRNNQ